MNPSRRQAIGVMIAGTGMAGLGLAMTPPTAAAAPQQQQPGTVIPILGAGAANAPFMDGLSAGLENGRAQIAEPWHLPAHDPDAMLALMHKLEGAPRGLTLVGLLDEGRHLILAEMIRHLGGRPLWSERIAAGAAADGGKAVGHVLSGRPHPDRATLPAAQTMDRALIPFAAQL